MAGDDDGAARGGEVGQDALDGAGRDGVDGLEGLVEDEHGGRVHQGAGQVDLLAHAGGVVGHEGGAGLPQAQDVEELGGAGDDDVALQAAQEAGVGDQLQAVEPVEGAQAVGQHAQERLGAQGVGPHVHAVDQGAPGVGHEEPGGHGQGRRLAGAVGADDAVDGAGRHGEVEHIDGDLLAEGLGQALADQGGGRRRRAVGREAGGVPGAVHGLRLGGRRDRGLIRRDDGPRPAPPPPVPSGPRANAGGAPPGGGAPPLPAPAARGGAVGRGRSCAHLATAFFRAEPTVSLTP